jgi:predicted nucleic-acid-binding protein
MRITVDTNLLVRIVISDDTSQMQVALRVLDQAETVALPLPCLCELVWVLGKVYGLPKDKIALSLRAIIGRKNISVDVPAVRAGLSLLDSGGDFADGAIAASGASMGGETFVSFDHKAVAQIAALGLAASHPASIQ